MNDGPPGPPGPASAARRRRRRAPAPGAGRVATGVAEAVARHPALWREAAHQAAALAPRGWWRRPPFAPLPDRAWLGFRLTTQYGDGGHRPEAADLVAWLAWARDARRKNAHQLRVHGFAG